MYIYILYYNFCNYKTHEFKLYYIKVVLIFITIMFESIINITSILSDTYEQVISYFSTDKSIEEEFDSIV